METKDYKLTIELVPEPVWFKSLRDAMERRNWDTIRFKAYADYNHKCGICECHPSRLECHEIWEYDDINHIQSLKGFIALCVMCHNLKHLGLAQIKADEGRLNYDDIVNHFIAVNGCSYDDFLVYRDSVFTQWEKRSNYEWTQDFGIYNSFLKG